MEIKKGAPGKSHNPKLLVNLSLASNFQTRERAKHVNSSLDQVDTKMILEVFIKNNAKW